MTITSSSAIVSVNLLLMTILQTSQPPSNTTTQNPTKDLNPFQMPSKISAPDLLHSLDDLHLNFHHDDVDSVSTDFGNIHISSPLTVLHPNFTSDIAALVRRVFELGRSSPLTVAARGHGHSLNGQSGTERGIVVRMESLMKSSTEMRIMRSSTGVVVEVSGGALWVEVLKESLKHGLAPKSWTDYLYLSVGGTLSNAGISGQAFKHGPQISNVQELEVVTGKGEIVNCSESNNSDLFHAVLGGLGQFGIISKARITLEPAPKKVKWIRVLYSDFMEFTGDQEMLILGDDNGFDYIEGFVIINKTGLLNNWRTSFNPKDPVQASQFESHGKTLYCLEITKNFEPEEEEDIDKEVERLLSKLRFIPSTLFITEVSYLEFLDRVHTSELKLQEEGLWEVPHPWINLFIPKSKIHQFAHGVFGNILTDSSSGPILMYPLNKRRWSDETSTVTPNEDIFYLVAFLSSASKSTESPNSVQKLQLQNRKVLEFCEKEGIGMKQYLPHYTKQEEWKAHYGSKWERFVQRKIEYDPLAILGPGHKIFKKSKPFS